MAKVFLIGLEKAAVQQIARALGAGRHRIHSKPANTPPAQLAGADILFVGGEGRQYLALLKGVRELYPSLPFVVVTRLPETADWLDAIEAGATDYCRQPCEPRHIHWLMDAALARGPGTAARSGGL